MARRVLTGILGVLSVIAGIVCLAWPGLTYISLAWIIGAVMIVDGVGNIVAWPERKSLGLANGWSLAGAIISLVFGIVLLASNGMRFLMDVYLVYMAAAWLIVYGVLRVVMAFKMRSARKKLLAAATNSGLVPAGAQAPKARWGWVLCMGILMVICGILGFLNPVMFAIALGTMIGITIVLFGFDMIVMAFAA